MGIVIPVIILFSYLIITKSINDFISYAILGIKEFTNKIEYLTLMQNDKIEIKILAISVPITIIIMAISIIILKLLKKENQMTKNVLTVLIYSLSIIIVMYPISDEIHFLIGSTITILGSLYLLYLVGKFIYEKLKLKNKKKIYFIITSIICIMIIFFILLNTAKNLYYYTNIEKNTEINHYRNIEIRTRIKI